MNQTRFLLNKMKSLPLGLNVFSRLICLKAPYFSTISPVFTHLDSGVGVARMKKRRAVQNHLGTVHAIAVCNLCEFVAGVTLEVTLPTSHRWIPKGMSVRYLKKADTDLEAKTSLTVESWPDAGPVLVHVDVYNERDEIVVDAEIEMYVSRKKS